MDYLKLDIESIHNALIKGEITPEELVASAIKKAKEDTTNAFEYICEKEALLEVENLKNIDKNNILWGIPYALKDNFSTKDIPTTASSNILNGYVPVYSATVYDLLKKQGAILIGKTTLDELAMGGTGTTGHKGVCYNPWDKSHKHQVGGSSCGSASAIASGIVPFSIGSDTGDSVRKPANNIGAVGMKPTWGRISRYGLFPFCPSLDAVGFFTRNVKDSAYILNALAGRDIKDATSSEVKVDNYISAINNSLKGKKFAVISEIYNSIKNETIKGAFNKTIEKITAEGGVVDFVSMDINLCKVIFPTYFVISCAEATSNNANLDGIKFGARCDGDNYEEIMINTRTQGFSEMIKRRFVFGSFALAKENQKELYLKAKKCRHLIVDAVNNILKDYDCIYLPASPSAAPLIQSEKVDKLSDEYLIADNYLAIGNFGGLPSITLPLGFDKDLPFGVNLTSKKFDETNLYCLANNIEKITGLHDLVAKEDR